LELLDGACIVARPEAILRRGIISQLSSFQVVFYLIFGTTGYESERD
jgi:hypothetical protein